MKKSDEDKKEDRVELGEKQEYIVYKDVINNYWESQSYHPRNNFDEFITKKKSIRNAMFLLPMDSEDPLIKKTVKELIELGLVALKKQPPVFTLKYHFIDIGKEGRRFVQEISAEGGDSWSCPLEPENTKQATQNFKEEQYKVCLEELIEAEFKISKFLVKQGIINKEDKSPNEMLTDWIKEEITNAKKELMVNTSEEGKPDA